MSETVKTCACGKTVAYATMRLDSREFTLWEFGHGAYRCDDDLREKIAAAILAELGDRETDE